jgi:hypothetical protein
MSNGASTNRRQQGVALLITMLVLAALAFLGLATLNAVMGDQQVSGYQARSRVAFHAAEAGQSAVQASLNGGGAPTISSANLGDTGIYPHGQPSYGPDPVIAAPVEDLGAIGAQGMNLRIGNGGPRYQVQFWKLNIQGSSPGGSIARVEAAVGVLRGN